MLIPFSRRFVIFAIVVLPWVIAWTNPAHQARPQFAKLTINWEQIDACKSSQVEAQLPADLQGNLKLDFTSYIYQATLKCGAYEKKSTRLPIREMPQPQQVAATQPAVEAIPQTNAGGFASVAPKKIAFDSATTTVSDKPVLAGQVATEPLSVLRPFRSVAAEDIYNPLRPQPVKQATDAAPLGAVENPSEFATLDDAPAGWQLEPARRLAEASRVLKRIGESTTPPANREEIPASPAAEINFPAAPSAAVAPNDAASVEQRDEVARAPVDQNGPGRQNGERVASRPAPVEAGEYDNSIRESIAPDAYRPQGDESKHSPNVPFVVAVKSPDDLMDEVWWSEKMKEPMRGGTRPLPLDLDSLLLRTLMHSAQIQVFSELPLIRETAVTEANANFDWHSFTETLWNAVSDPVGSSLTVGGDGTRFRDQRVTALTGVRRRNQVGGQVEFDQEFGHESSNSTYFIPNNQGTARLRMSYTHPLLRGSGRVYNQSLIVLAEVDTSVARDELVRQVSGHLLEVTRAYWGLALERATYLQKVRLYESSRDILRNLEARRELDTYRSQIVRAQSAVSSRESDLIRAEVAIRNAEARIRALVNDEQLGNDQTTELIPMDQPISHDLGVDLQETLTVALQKRPEIAQAFKQIRAASVRQDMTKNELLPTLNLLMTSYVSGLQGNSATFQAWADQFSVGQPSYSVGLNLEVPLGNRAARARDLRRRLELRQFESQLRLTMETVNLEVGVAVRETVASFQEMLAKYRAMQAAAQDNQFVQKRWELLPGDNANASLVFDDLIRTQQRLTEAEIDFVAAQTTYNLSLTNLKKAAGILLETEQVATARTVINGVPTIIFDKSDVPVVGELNAPSFDPPVENPQAPTTENGLSPK